MYWSKLSMADRANYIQIGVKNGITSLDTIRETYNKYAEGGYIGDENNPIELPNYDVYPYNIELNTYKPFNKQNFIGHSTIRLNTPDNSLSNIVINTRMKDRGYNLINSNCSDDTREVLESVTGKQINPFLFTTPGDVRDFFIDNGAIENNNKRSNILRKLYPNTFQSHTMNVTKAEYERGINRALEIRNKRKKEVYNKYAEGGIVNLPELVVTPEPWQNDFNKNFTDDKKILNRTLRGLQVMSGGKGYEMKDEKFKDDFSKYKQAHTIIRETTNNFKDIDITDAAHRLYNVWNEAGRPDITNDKSVMNWLFPSRANYNPLLNKTYRTDTIEDIIAELAHPIQDKYGKYNKWYYKPFDFLKTIYGEVSGNRVHYDDKRHYEGETHGVIEPEIKSYIYRGVPTDYIPKSKNR